MSKTLAAVRKLVAAGDVRISEHGYDELVADGIAVREVLAGIAEAQVVEDYPGYPKGPTVLVLQSDREREPVHIVWGVPEGHSRPAVLVTGYRPDPGRWTADFIARRK